MCADWNWRPVTLKTSRTLGAVACDWNPGLVGDSRPQKRAAAAAAAAERYVIVPGISRPSCDERSANDGPVGCSCRIDVGPRCADAIVDGATSAATRASTSGA